MRTVKSSTSREVAARPHTGVEVPQEGLFAEIRALDAKTTILDRIARSPGAATRALPARPARLGSTPR